MRTKAELAAVITGAQRLCCAYDGFGKTPRDCNPADRCDCKYGADRIGRMSEDGNGCPELREVAAIFAEMTDVEFERIVKRMHRKARQRVREFEKAVKGGVL